MICERGDRDDDSPRRETLDRGSRDKVSAETGRPGYLELSSCASRMWRRSRGVSLMPDPQTEGGVQLQPNAVAVARFSSSYTIRAGGVKRPTDE